MDNQSNELKKEIQEFIKENKSNHNQSNEMDNQFDELKKEIQELRKEKFQLR